jgi:hypothetical protein
VVQARTASHLFAFDDVEVLERWMSANGCERQLDPYPRRETVRHTGIWCI